MVELSAPESIADSIEGRTPKTIDAKHYMILLRQAKQYYPKYAEYITKQTQIPNFHRPSSGPYLWYKDAQGGRDKDNRSPEP